MILKRQVLWFLFSVVLFVVTLGFHYFIIDAEKQEGRCPLSYEQCSVFFAHEF